MVQDERRQIFIVVTYTRNLNPVLKNYFIDQAQIVRETGTKDLGMIFDSKVIL